MGATDEDIEEMRQKDLADAEAQEHFFIWDENWPSLLFFLDLVTQWRFVGTMVAVVRTGLDHTAVQSRMDRRRMTPEQQDQLWEDLDAMEREVLRVDTEARLRARARNWRD